MTKNNNPNFNKVTKDEIEKGRRLLKQIFLPGQEIQEREGISNNFSIGSFAREEIEIVGEKVWLDARWMFLEKYESLEENYRKIADFCFPVALKIFEFQAKKVPEPVIYTKLVEAFNGRFEKKYISLALDILVDFMFIRYETGEIGGGWWSNGLIKFTSEIPDICIISA